jgi:membrane protein DedA with SNARE-associated domain
MRRLSGVLLVGFLGTLVKQDPALGIFAVIFLEEMGVPLLIPGDVFILVVGAQIGRGRVSWPLAFLAIVAGAVLGASILFTVSRRFGAPFLHKYGRYIHVYPRELDAAERVFHRWGLWAVILGRHIPGLRVVISAIAGLLRFELARFAVAVAVSSAAWALIFLALGAHFGRRLRPLLHIPPAHLIPWVLFGLLCMTVVGYVLRRRLYEGGYHLVRYTLRIGRGH